MYREVTHSSYARVPNSADIEADSYDNQRRASTVETLRRRPEPSATEAEKGSRAGSAYSSASTVAAGVHGNTYGSGGAYQQVV